MHVAYMPKEAAVTVRIPADLERKPQLRSRRERRSLSSEIAVVLERSVEEQPLRRPGPLDLDPLDQFASSRSKGALW